MKEYTFVLKLPEVVWTWHSVFSGIEMIFAGVFSILIGSYLSYQLLRVSVKNDAALVETVVAAVFAWPFAKIMNWVAGSIDYVLIHEEEYKKYKEKSQQLDELYDIGGSE